MCVVTWMFRNDADPCCRSKSHKLTYPSSPEVYDRNHMVEYLEPFRNVHENLYLWVWENVVNKTNSYLKNSPWCSNLHLSPIEPFFFYDMNVAKDDATPVEKKNMNDINCLMLEMEMEKKQILSVISETHYF